MNLEIFFVFNLAKPHSINRRVKRLILRLAERKIKPRIKLELDKT